MGLRTVNGSGHVGGRAGSSGEFSTVATGLSNQTSEGELTCCNGGKQASTILPNAHGLM